MLTCRSLAVALGLESMTKAPVSDSNAALEIKRVIRTDLGFGNGEEACSSRVCPFRKTLLLGTCVGEEDRAGSGWLDEVTCEHESSQSEVVLLWSG